jgi:hypothetical protein
LNISNGDTGRVKNTIGKENYVNSDVFNKKDYDFFIDKKDGTCQIARFYIKYIEKHNPNKKEPDWIPMFTQKEMQNENAAGFAVKK